MNASDEFKALLQRVSLELHTQVDQGVPIKRRDELLTWLKTSWEPLDNLENTFLIGVLAAEIVNNWYFSKDRPQDLKNISDEDFIDAFMVAIGSLMKDFTEQRIEYGKENGEGNASDMVH